MKKIGLYLSLAFSTYLIGQFIWILTFIYDEPIFGSEYFETMTLIIIFTIHGIFGLIGGISLNQKDEIEKYFDFMIKEHKKQNPEIQVIEKYVGIKNEVSLNSENRNYLFHINLVSKYKNVWSVIPGKFTLAFSLAPEFYRIVYKKNPRKMFSTFSDDGKFSHLIADTIWGELQN